MLKKLKMGPNLIKPSSWFCLQKEVFDLLSLVPTAAMSSIAYLRHW